MMRTLLALGTPGVWGLGFRVEGLGLGAPGPQD